MLNRGFSTVNIIGKSIVFIIKLLCYSPLKLRQTTRFYLSVTTYIMPWRTML